METIPRLNVPNARPHFTALASRDCQAEDWKVHKKQCSHPEVFVHDVEKSLFPDLFVSFLILIICYNKEAQAMDGMGAVGISIALLVGHHSPGRPLPMDQSLIQCPLHAVKGGVLKVNIPLNL